MPLSHLNADLWTYISVMALSVVSGFISIAQRIARGHLVNTLWIISEFLAALLFGYLMFDAYPIVQRYGPDWLTLPIAVAAAAHFGGRSLQAIEHVIYERLGLQRFTTKV